LESSQKEEVEAAKLHLMLFVAPKLQPAKARKIEL
jgi:hypothetical protein